MKPIRTDFTAKSRRLATALAVALASGLLAACGTYVEPKAGVYKGMGVVESDLTCSFEQPTARAISSWSCRKTAEMAEETRRAQEMLESVRIYQPRTP